MRPRERLGDLLVDSGVVSREDVEAAAEEASQHRRLLGEQLIAREWCREADVYRALAKQRGLRFDEISSVLTRLDATAQRLIPAAHQRRLRAMPVRVGDVGVEIVTANPNLSAFDLARLVNGPVELTLVTPSDLRRLETDVELGMVVGAAPRVSTGPSAQLSRILEAMLSDAAHDRASDVHLEIYEDRVRTRVRIDGDLIDRPNYHFTGDQQRGLVNLIKIKGELDIAEHRLPMSGRASIEVDGKPYDLRIQTQPVPHGENVVIRLLAPQSTLLGIQDLGFPSALAARYRRLLDTPTGMVLVVGPTGSGKSTTLYAGLQVLASDATRKVITVEDPIEYTIDNVQQTQVNRVVGFDFADAMRVFVRQDPDVIFIGEIRDTETAREAIRASQTGHLVFSTMHCNDTVDAVQRLFDLDMHPNSIASELMAVMSQRLAKRICVVCRAPAELRPALLAEIFPEGAPSGFGGYAGAGCPRCSGRGNSGRIAVIELLPAGGELRRAISRRLPLDDLRAVAARNGLMPLLHHALSLVVQGVISLEELPTMLSPEALRLEGPMERWYGSYQS